MLELVTATLLVTGAGFALVGSIGLVRLPDIYTRLHAPTKATTVGVGSIVLAWLVHFSGTTGTVSLRALAISLFLFITAPVSAHLIGRAALAARPEAVEEPTEHVGAAAEGSDR